REPDRLLADMVEPIVLKPLDHCRAGFGIERGTEPGRLMVVDGEAGCEGRPDHHLIEVFDYVAALVLPTAPPGGDGGQFERHAQQRFAETGQEGREGARLEDAGAQRVD